MEDLLIVAYICSFANGRWAEVVSCDTLPSMKEVHIETLF